jgi:lysyl-tRNA synthetase class 2
MEVETPVLGRVASGAAARPFTTHYNFLEEDYRLRISLELHLKRLLVGGYEKVYEIGKVFRNEDLDATHSPEFTMLELYWAFADYEDIRKLVEETYHHLAEVASQILPSPQADERLRSFTPPFARADFVESLEKASGIHDLLSLPVEQLRSLALGAGAAIPEDAPAGVCMDKLFSRYVEPSLKEPTFVFDYPFSTTPLAKRHRSKPGRVERFELFYHGMELGNAYSELNDPDDQEARFLEQVRDLPEDTYAYDSDFVEALRYGMPPAGGLGIGIDRLIMVILGMPSIKDVVLFPPTRSKAEGGA